MRRKLRQHVTVSCVDLSHRCRAFFVNADVGFVAISGFRACGKIHNANAYPGEWLGGNVIAVPVTVADVPLPCHLIQTQAQRVCGRIIADERISSGHGLRQPLRFGGSRLRQVSGHDSSRAVNASMSWASAPEIRTKTALRAHYL